MISWRRRFGALGRACAVLLVVAAAGSAGCGRGAGSAPGGGSGGGSSSRGRSGDALFLASAPVWIPEENEPDLTAMGIGRLYVAAASSARGVRR